MGLERSSSLLRRDATELHSVVGRLGLLVCASKIKEKWGDKR